MASSTGARVDCRCGAVIADAAPGHEDDPAAIDPQGCGCRPPVPILEVSREGETAGTYVVRLPDGRLIPTDVLEHLAVVDTVIAETHEEAASAAQEDGNAVPA